MVSTSERERLHAEQAAWDAGMDDYAEANPHMLFGRIFYHPSPRHLHLEPFAGAFRELTDAEKDKRRLDAAVHETIKRLGHLRLEFDMDVDERQPGERTTWVMAEHGFVVGFARDIHARTDVIVLRHDDSPTPALTTFRVDRITNIRPFEERRAR